jgi:hypothetical protein
VCTLRQEELEIENLRESFSDTSAKLQDIYVVLDDSTLLPELKKRVQISDVSMNLWWQPRDTRAVLMPQLWP